MPVSPARAAAFDILLRVEQQDAYASELLHSDRLDNLSTADRGLTTEIVMGVLRWRSRLDSALAGAIFSATGKAGRSGSDRAPHRGLSASVLEPRARARRHQRERGAGQAGAQGLGRALRECCAAKALRSSPRSASTRNASGTTAAQLAAEFAHPEWLVERWVEALRHRERRSDLPP